MSKTCTYIDGIGSSQAIDTAGEIVDIKGLDISSLPGAPANWEHESKLPSQIVGKITEAKKIFSEKDCDTERQRFYWTKCQLPFLYVMIRLFDDKKDSAKEVAGLFLDDAEHPNEPDMVGFSVEGAKIEKVGAVITRSIARKVTITCIPANKTCIAEMMPPKKAPKNDLDHLFKGELELFQFEPSYVELMEKKENLKKNTPAPTPTPTPPPPPPPVTAEGISAGFNGAMGLGGIKKKEMKKYNNMSNGYDSAGGGGGGSAGGGAFIGSQLAASEESEAPPLTKPYSSEAQRRWAHTQSGKEALGGEAGVHEWDEASKGKKLPEKVSKKELKKALEAGSANVAPGQMVGGAVLGVESLDRKKKKTGLEDNTTIEKKEKSKWSTRADEAYGTWDKKNKFKEYMKNRMPNLAEGEIDAIGRVLALKKDMQKEDSMSKMYASHYTKKEGEE